ncbi:MAG TPA: hypothetical protein VD794_07435 [Flavisolibacter sp.]|nr:hypothetical protein [Flavisolibacter sp.]
MSKVKQIKQNIVPYLFFQKKGEGGAHGRLIKREWLTPALLEKLQKEGYSI